MEAVLLQDRRQRFLSGIKDPCHTVVYDLGWTGYLPCSRK